MAISRKIMLISLGAAVALLILIAVAVIYLVNTDAYKPSLQTAASEALGMEVIIEGRVGISLFPSVSLSMNDVHLRNHGKQLMVAEQLRLGLEALALLQHKVQITNISLIHPKITIERGVDGRYNFDGPQTAAATTPDVSLAQLAVTDGVLQYADRQSGWVLAAADCSLNLRNLVLVGAGADSIKNLSFAAKLHCGKIGTEGYAASDLTLSLKANNGVFVANPITLKFLGGDGSASMQADYSGKTPRYHLRFSLPSFRIEQLLKTQSQEAVVAGPMDLFMDLSLQGSTGQQLKQSASGEVALRGNDLELKGHDLDMEFSRFESSQNFSMLDMGALFIAGPTRYQRLTSR